MRSEEVIQFLFAVAENENKWKLNRWQLDNSVKYTFFCLMIFFMLNLSSEFFFYFRKQKKDKQTSETMAWQIQCIFRFLSM